MPIASRVSSSWRRLRSRWERSSSVDSRQLSGCRLGAALATAKDLRDSGLSFVVGPIPTLAGEPLVRLNRRFAAALYPYIDGQSFTWGDPRGATHRSDLLNLIVTLHTAPTTATRHAITDDFAVPHRDILASALDHEVAGRDGGPYTDQTLTLVADNAQKIQRLLVRYDDLVDEFRSRPTRMVLTHGEPHPGNTMLTHAGLVLIDWDTVLLAPPERDLWILDAGDGSVVGAYSAATGITPLPSIFALYRIRWDLADTAAYVHRFWGSHAGTLDDDQSWDELRSLIDRLSS
ncbi:MAG TPA: phosphotransferase [Acidimicrobiia bacterium]|nr:phosphotransferase [Acidimicrobiia bacterium]